MAKEALWHALRSKGYSAKAVAVLLGHAQAESGLECDRLQGDFSADRALSRRYTAQVDSGAIDRGSFAWHGPNGGGYGLVQWTYPTRKLGLYDTARRLGVSIGSEKAAVEWLDAELHQAEYAPVLTALRGGGSIREISDVVMHRFERPADQSEAACAHRAGLAQALYDELAGAQTAEPSPAAAAGAGQDAGPQALFWPPRMLDEGMDGPDVQLYQSALLCRGYRLTAANGRFDSRTTEAARSFQREHGLEADGVIGPLTGRALLRWEESA